MARIIEDDAGLAEVVKSLKRVVILGIKTEEQRDQPAFFVAEYLASAGVEVVPVPVYYPEVTSILGRPVFRKLAEVPGPVDCVDVFRRPADIDQHVDALITLKPKVVWFQLGIRNDKAAARLVAAGIDVVQNRCLLVEHRRLAR